MESIRRAPIGIIGGGFGALITYITLRFRGVPAKDILIFSPDTSPEQAWERSARAINLTWLRSESSGHFYPTDSPGLATIQSLKTFSLKPIIQSWFDRYHPTVDFLIQHIRKLADQTGFYRVIIPTKITHIERLENEFAIYGEAGNRIAVVQHVMLAVGHGRERLPEAIKNFREKHPGDNRVVTSFESKTYGPRSVLVIGDGITAATEWANVLQAGGAVAAVSRDGFRVTQPLQVPRHYFSRRGLAKYQKKSGQERLHELHHATRGSIPANPAWKKLFRKGQATGRLGLVKGFVKEITISNNGRLDCEVEFTDQQTTHTFEVDQVISATGFMSATTHPLLAHLIKQYKLPTIEGILQVDNNCCISELSTPTSVFAVIGTAAAWATPCSDSFAGMKISARTFARHVIGSPTPSPRDVWEQTKQWGKLVIGKEIA